MKSFSLDSPESPSVQATPPSAAAGAYPPSEQLLHEQQHHQYEIYASTSPNQHQLYQAQAQAGQYQRQYFAADYRQYPTEPDAQLAAYLSASQTRVGVSGGQYQHRHSYQNPSSLQYGPQAQRAQQLSQREPARNTSASQSALNSVGPQSADKLGGRGSSEAVGESQSARNDCKLTPSCRQSLELLLNWQHNRITMAKIYTQFSACASI